MLLLIPEILGKYKLPLWYYWTQQNRTESNILIMQFPGGKTACQSYSELFQKQTDMISSDTHFG